MDGVWFSRRVPPAPDNCVTAAMAGPYAGWAEAEAPKATFGIWRPPMTKPKKHPKDMTTEEIAKVVFHPKLHKKLREIAHAKDGKSATNSSSQ